MNSIEYANLAALERDHWYYSGKRALVRYWLSTTGTFDSRSILLDCGAGTGAFAKEMEALCRVVVLDDHEESLEQLRRRFDPTKVLKVSATGIPLPNESVNAVTALDVLEHISDDRTAVVEMARVLLPKGVIVATVPACMSLWSDWDEALHHFRRYTRPQLLALFPSQHWEILHVNYTNVPVFPVVWLLRKWRRLRGRKGNSVGRAEDKIPPRWLNAFLRWTFVTLGKSRIPFPFGVSLILVARKR